MIWLVVFVTIHNDTDSQTTYLTDSETKQQEVYPFNNLNLT